MSKIVKDISILRKKSENTTSVDEARSLISDLENILEKTDNGIGLAAIQIGCPKKVGVIKDGNGKYFHLINPEIIEKSEEFVYFNEGCLSFPNVFKNTKRYKQITVKHQKIVDEKFEDEIFVSYYSFEDEPGNNGLMAIAVQHEIDHFSGTLIIDSEVKNEPIIRENEKIGRNDPCPCKSGKKFKKCCGK